MHDAVRLADPRYVRILLDAGADPDVRAPIPDDTAAGGLPGLGTRNA
jgi:hypothetical protein